MTSGIRTTTRSDTGFTDAEFQAVARLAKETFGLHLEASKKALIQSRLSRHLKRLNVSGVDEYCALVKRTGSSEKHEFISALTTNVTQFFREAHHFAYLENEILPEFAKTAAPGRPLRIWSAGCSTGQEAYSIAALARSRAQGSQKSNVRILATDVDDEALGCARSGVYRLDTCQVPDARYKSILQASTSKRQTGTADEIAMNDSVRTLIEFRKLNLVEDWALPQKFDVIMCRNVAIYFDQATQSRLWARLAAQLSPGGTLFIGHSERLHGAATQVLKNVGITTYRRHDETMSQRQRAE